MVAQWLRTYLSASRVGKGSCIVSDSPLWRGSTFSRRTEMSTAKRIVLVLGIAVFGMLAISALHRVEAQLNEDDFVSLATQGFMRAVDGDHPEGSRRNSYIWSMRWWHDILYVGTLRDAICLFGTGGVLAPGYETVCPPPGVFLTPEQRAEIWAYTPGGREGTHGTWQRVFQSPLVGPPAAVPSA